MRKIIYSLLVVFLFLLLGVNTLVANNTDMEEYQALVGFEVGSVPEEINEEDKAINFPEAVTDDEEQGPVWFYLSEDSDGVSELYYTPDWGDNWQYSETPHEDSVYYSIFDWEGFKVSAGMWGEENIKTIIGWRAYDNGTAVIEEWDYTAFDGETDLEETVEGAVIKIVKGSAVQNQITEAEVLFSAVTTLENNIFKGTEVTVSKGDMLFLTFDGSEAPAANIDVDSLAVELQ